MAEIKTSSDIPLSSRILQEANRSAQARKNIGRWYAAKERGELVLLASCSDARIEPSIALGTVSVATDRSIAAAHKKEPFKFFYSHKGIKFIIVAGHFDGDQLRNHETPLSCGGHVAKAKRKSTVGVDQGIYQYVDSRIATADVSLQSIISAREIAAFAGRNKPVLAAVVDHLTQYIYPIALITNGGEQIMTSYSRQEFSDLQSFYRQGRLPEMRMQDIRNKEIERLIITNHQIVERYTKSLEFVRSQKVQDPIAVVMSSANKSAALRYPGVFDRPNTNFNVHLPIRKDFKELDESGPIFVRREDLAEAVAQVEYPLHKAVDAIGSGNDFFHTRTLILETPDLALSGAIAEELLKNLIFQQWLEKRQGKVILGEVKKGFTTRMIDLKLA